MKHKEDSEDSWGESRTSARSQDEARKIRRVLDGDVVGPPPVWLMRQAGRYLPEYRAVRASVPSFLRMAYDPALAAKVTLQPVQRFDLDAAIIFSDILVVPHALGRRLDFVEGEGPRLDPIDAAAVERLDIDHAMERLSPVMEVVSRVRSDLAVEKTLIGFCGAPWTVATYMIAGRGTPDQAPALAFAAAEPEAMQRLVNVLVEISADYLVGQIRAGADVVQIFDTWAGVLDDDGFRRWCIEPTAAIVKAVKANEPDARIVGFPKGIDTDRLQRYVALTGVDAVSIDWTVPLAFARDQLQPLLAVQGNLDPKLLVEGGDALHRAVEAILAALGGGRFIFNLGHGILPETPVENVARLVEWVRVS